MTLTIEERIRNLRLVWPSIDKGDFVEVYTAFPFYPLGVIFGMFLGFRPSRARWSPTAAYALILGEELYEIDAMNVTRVRVWSGL